MLCQKVILARVSRCIRWFTANEDKNRLIPSPNDYYVEKHKDSEVKKMPLISSLKPYTFQGRKETICNNFALLKKLLALAASGGKGWMQVYMKVERLVKDDKRRETLDQRLQREWNVKVKDFRKRLKRRTMWNAVPTAQLTPNLNQN